MLAKLKTRIISIPRWRILSAILIIYDFLAIHMAYFLALWFRFDCSYNAIPAHYLNSYFSFIPAFSALSIVIFLLCKMYRSVWRYVSFETLLRTLSGSVLSSILHTILITLIFMRMPASYYVWGALFQLILLTIPRFSIRFAYYLIANLQNSRSSDANVMIIGAGAAGQMILRDIQTAKELNMRVVCFIDDNPNKWNRYVEGVPVVGGRDDILASVEKYKVDKIFIAIPSASAKEIRNILQICNETNCELKRLPGLYQLVNGQVSVSTMKKISVEDLLGREPIKTDMKEVFQFIKGKVVLVTGGGGSIGSELCRQIAAHKPEQLIIFDIYENNAYDIQLELKEKYPYLNLVTLIGSVRDSRRVFQVFHDYRPQIVYHAAAHKHVPLMEDSACESIKNNAIGTYKTAYAAMVHGCERFVLISTDKAVNPTNIMGASKRLCEMIIQSFDAKIKEGKAEEIPQLFTHKGIERADKDGTGEIFRNAKTEFVAVRFGNVLGSNGSVIPVFRKQIEKGGPVTVTHPDIIRYFMTIPEAVSLVMLAGTYAKGGEIFVLDMGSPVKIDALARNLIKLSGYTPGEDIEIVYTGLRPGEKLYEEKLMAEEGLRRTKSKLIHIGMPIPFDVDIFLEQLEDLMLAAYDNRKDIRQLVEKMVSTYRVEK